MSVQAIQNKTKIRLQQEERPSVKLMSECLRHQKANEEDKKQKDSSWNDKSLNGATSRIIKWLILVNPVVAREGWTERQKHKSRQHKSRSAQGP